MGVCFFIRIIMRIEHIALYVQDLEKAKDFFVQFFCGQAGKRYINPTTHFQSYFILFDKGARLEIMTVPNLKKEDLTPCVGYAHMAFSVGSIEEVDKLTQALEKAGYIVKSGPRYTGDGYYESCVQGPEQILIEITE